MAVGVGVVVSAFRLTPFFCRKVRDRVTPGPFLVTPSPPRRPNNLIYYLGKGLSWRSC